MTALRTRKPTGRVPWPLILIEGGEKSGKSWACAQFSTSARIGQMYWLDLNEGAGDEYGAIPGAKYDVIVHDGTWADILGQVEAVRDEARRAADAGEPPIVLAIDSMTAEWDMHKDWASDKARQRHNAKARKYNRRELGADEEPTISMDLWNEAGSRHRKLMTMLMTFPGIVLVTARGKEVAALDDNGKPIERQREYRVEGHKTLGFDVSCWIRLDRSKPGIVVGLRSVHSGVRPGYDDPIELAEDWSVEGIVFDALGCDPVTAHTRNLVELKAHEPELVDQLLEQIRTADRDTLGAAIKACGSAEQAGHIGPDDVEALKAAIGARRTQLMTDRPAAGKNPGNDPKRRRMMQLFTEADLAARNDRLEFAAEVVGHDIATTNDLTDAEIAAVVDRLERYIAQQTPPQDREPVGASA